MMRQGIYARALRILIFEICKLTAIAHGHVCAQDLSRAHLSASSTHIFGSVYLYVPLIGSHDQSYHKSIAPLPISAAQ